MIDVATNNCGCHTTLCNEVAFTCIVISGTVFITGVLSWNTAGGQHCALLVPPGECSGWLLLQPMTMAVTLVLLFILIPLAISFLALVLVL